MNAIEEMHSRIATLTSQIERARADAEDERSQAVKLDTQADQWTTVRRDYEDILAAYAKSDKVIYPAF